MQERGEQPDQRSILEKIRSASNQGDLGVTIIDLENEFSRLTETGDAQTMRDIVDAYFTLELHSFPSYVPEDAIRTLVLDNFDYVAAIADARKVGKDDASTMSLARDNPYPHAGKTQQFFRDAVNYHPKPPAAPQN